MAPKSINSELLLDGTNDSKGLAESLESVWIESNVGKWPKVNQDLLMVIPDGKISIPLEDIFKQLLAAGHLETVYEYLVILHRKKLSIHANLLEHFMPFVSGHPKIGFLLQDCLGPTGEYLCKNTKSWSWLNTKDLGSLTKIKDGKQKLFAFETMCRSNPEEAYRTILSNVGSIDSKQLSGFLHSLYPYSHKIQFEFEPFAQVISAKDQRILYAYLLTNQSSKIFSEFELAYDQYLGSFDRSRLISPALLKKGKTHKAEFFISVIPPDWITERDKVQDILSNLFKDGLMPALIENVALYRSEKMAGLLLDWLVRNGEFKEEVKVENLSEFCNHSTFNSCLIRLSQFYPGTADLEACFRFMNNPFHFWEEDLYEEVLRWHGHVLYEKKYSLEVFFNMIPFRVNPMKIDGLKIPGEIKNRIQTVIPLDKILNFRKLMRS